MGNIKPEAEKEETRRRRKVRERLTRVRRNLAGWEERLMHIHADRTGAYRFWARNPPLLTEEWSYVAESLRTIERAAESGCDLSQAWLSDTAMMREWIDHMRHQRPPERDPNYDGPMMHPATGARLGKPYRDKNVFKRNARPAAEIVAADGTEQLERRAAKETELAARIAERKARTAYLLVEFNAEEQHPGQ